MPAELPLFLLPKVSASVLHTQKPNRSPLSQRRTMELQAQAPEARVTVVVDVEDAMLAQLRRLPRSLIRRWRTIGRLVLLQAMPLPQLLMATLQWTMRSCRGIPPGRQGRANFQNC